MAQLQQAKEWQEREEAENDRADLSDRAVESELMAAIDKAGNVLTPESSGGPAFDSVFQTEINPDSVLEKIEISLPGASLQDLEKSSEDFLRDILGDELSPVDQI